MLRSIRFGVYQAMVENPIDAQALTCGRSGCGRNVMRLLMIWVIVVLPFLLGACNTVNGFGQDMSAAGHGVSDAATWAMGGKPATATAPPPAAAQGSSAMPGRPSATPRQPPEQPKYDAN